MKIWGSIGKKQQNNNNPRKRILFVDDEKIVNEIIKDVLDDENQFVTVASNGEDALALLKDNSFDLVISDVKMPGMDGIQLLSEIKKIDSTIAVIMLTAFGDRELYLKAMSCGAAEYLNKPVGLYEIKSIVQQYLNRSGRFYMRRIKSKLRVLLSKMSARII